METRRIKLSKIVQNRGQVEGVPKNPRRWSDRDVEKLARSIEETPELLEARPPIVYELEGRYVILGGNMRYDAVRSLGWEDIPCIVVDSTFSPDKLKEIVIKDNGQWGQWDMDRLANEWDDSRLAEWGLSVPGASQDEAQEESPSSSGECERKDRIIITFPKDMRGVIEDLLGIEYNPDKATIKAETLSVE